MALRVRTIRKPVEGGAGIGSRATASVALADGDAVYLTSTSGEVALARANASGTMGCVGVADAAISSGQAGDIIALGIRSSPNWNFSGYLGRVTYVSRVTAGALTPDVTTFLSGDIKQQIGSVYNASSLWIALGIPVKVDGAGLSLPF